MSRSVREIPEHFIKVERNKKTVVQKLLTGYGHIPCWEGDFLIINHHFLFNIIGALEYHRIGYSIQPISYTRTGVKDETN